MKTTFKAVLIITLIWNIILTVKVFFVKNASFEIIDAERINIVEKDGTKKLGIFSSGQYEYGISQRPGQGRLSGLLFFNEDGYEAGGLVFKGKASKGGHDQGLGLTFDGYRQDQAISIQHQEIKTDSTSYYEDGIRIMSRPDFSDVKEEYGFYKLKFPERFGDSTTPRLSKKEIDSLEYVLASKNKIAASRIYIGSKRGLKNGEWFDESGLYVKNRYGKNVLKIYVDESNKPKIEVLDSLGKSVKYDLIKSIN